MNFMQSVALCLSLTLAGCATQPVTTRPINQDFYASLDNEHARIDPQLVAETLAIYRRAHSLPAVYPDNDLQVLAQQQADFMARTGKLDIQTSNQLLSAWDQHFNHSAQTRPTRILANISAGYHNWPEAFSGWRDSPPHNAHMLDPQINRMAIATAYTPHSKYKVFWMLLLAD